MQLPSALLSIPHHHAPTLCYPGHQIGRTASARLRVHHPAISEAHALLSLRDGRLWLLALRRPLPLAQPEWQVPLRPGEAVPLAAGIELMVHEAWSSSEQLGLRIDGGPAQALSSEAWSLDQHDGRLRLRPEPGTTPLLRWWWTDGELWAQPRGGVAAATEPGVAWEVAGSRIDLVLVPTRSEPWTQALSHRPRTQVRVSPRLAVVQDEQGGRAELTGNAAIALWAVATFLDEEGEQAAPWQCVTTAIWGGRQAMSMRDNLRNNVLYRLDQRLRLHGLRDDLLSRNEGLLWFGDGVEVTRVAEADGV